MNGNCKRGQTIVLTPFPLFGQTSDRRPVAAGDDAAPQMDCGSAAPGKLEEPQREIASMGEVPFKHPQMNLMRTNYGLTPFWFDPFSVFAGG
jgi:hypothetical protein